ncbi:MAG: DNA-directed RNA polymerase subunit alpha C-terminal domain-containing protein [Thermoguttaceae bacterium]
MIASVSESTPKQILLTDTTFGPKEVAELGRSIRDSVNVPSLFESLSDAVRDLEAKDLRDELSPSDRVRLGIGYYISGQFEKACEILKKSDGGALSLFYLAKSQFGLRQYTDAIKNYELAQKSGYNSDDCTIGLAEVYCEIGDIEKSLAALDKISGATEQTAEYLSLRGATIAKIGDNPDEAIALFKRAISVDKNHPGALFGLALESERRGNDRDAVDLYVRAAKGFPTHVGVLFNLGVLYEDLEQYERAVECYQRILSVYPDHKKARLFLKDAKASSEMHIDEEAQRRKDRIGQILNLPVSDFELSVRSRNCLRSMGIMSLGDLCKHSEPELLASKNFGETSLIEIREMLSLKGLQLGQFSGEKPSPEPVEIETLSPDEQAVLQRPIIDLNLSVRARKCMTRLNIQTIGDLVRHTQDELLECKNFGVTSLKEIRERLTVFDIKLRGE